MEIKLALMHFLVKHINVFHVAIRLAVVFKRLLNEHLINFYM